MKPAVAEATAPVLLHHGIGRVESAPSTGTGSSTPTEASELSDEDATAEEKRMGDADVEKAAAKMPRGGAEEARREIYGVGRNFNKELGTGAFRTGGEMKMLCDLPTMVEITRRNILTYAKGPEHSIRLFVQGSKFWFSDCTPEELLDQILIECSGPDTARDIRRRDAIDDLVPVCLCMCEAREPLEDGTPQSVCQWLFRHDVIDGWRSLRYVFTCGFDTHLLVHKKLKARYEAKQQEAARSSTLVKMAKMGSRAAAALVLTPAAFLELKRISSVSQYGERRKFYAHVVVELETLKAIGKENRLGSLSNVLTCVILEAYFAADPSKQRANVGNAVLFNPDSPHGNHMCMKVCSVPRKGCSLKATAAQLRRKRQQLTDAWTVMVSRAYALGHLPKRVNGWIETRQKNLDFLVSSLPGTERSTPPCTDLHVCREFTNWHPNIVYCLGLNGMVYMDFYWEVQPSFDEAGFLKTLIERIGPVRHHTQLPAMY